MVRTDQTDYNILRKIITYKTKLQNNKKSKSNIFTAGRIDGKERKCESGLRKSFIMKADIFSESGDILGSKSR